MNYLRGRQGKEHLVWKRAMVPPLRQLGFLFFVFEHWCCDLMAVRPGSPHPFVLGVEIERASRHFEINAVRDLANGCSQVLVACINDTLRDRVVAHLSVELRNRIAVRTVQEILAGDASWMRN